jgi:hypothetical protein
MMKSRMMRCDRARRIRIQRVWTKQAWTKHMGRVALAGALGLIALAGLAPQAARAQDNGLFGSMLRSLGIGGESQIEYRDRPPLVVPPTRDLPPPQTSAAARDPNWPVDPKSGQPRKKGGDQIRDLDKIAVPQRPVEPGIAGSGASNPSAGATGAIPATQPAASGGLFGSLFGSSNQPASPTKVPARNSLTQPPPDYESPAPSQPYGTAPRADSAKSTTPESTQPGASGL